MFIIIPVGHESNEVRRLPWITFGIMAVCLVVHIFLSMDVGAKENQLGNSAEELVRYYFNHPYLELNPEIRELMFSGGNEERLEAMLAAYRQMVPRPDRYTVAAEQEELDRLGTVLLSSLDDVPYRKWGYIPADRSLLALLTYMFIHGGWLHLFGNLLLLYITGPFIEDLWGRPIYAAFYLTIGALSALMYASHYPNFTGPLIGASGAIAGVMGAFLVNFYKTKINFFYWIGFFFRGTFEAPAFVMLPIWVLLEFFNANVIDSIQAEGSGGGGVAHWAHVWGFVFGVLVAVGLKYLKIEEKYIHPKIEAKIQNGEGAVDVVITAMHKKNMGRIDEAYDILLEEAKKNPMRKDVVDALWDVGIEMGNGEEAATFFIKLIENEVRHDQFDVALKRFMDLKSKFPQASISPTYKLALLQHMIESNEREEAHKLATELLDEVNPSSSSVMLQNFAGIAKKLNPSIAKKTIELCLDHPEIPPDQKELLRTDLKNLYEGTEVPVKF
ncbi:MAG: rhomboid family intramembrane serine protease [Candidatus Aminicenantes bacterium]|nr:MAG: rhomboid family intramembrane serine protease [Candidatus Aminicenantes bacterium]